MKFVIYGLLIAFATAASVDWRQAIEVVEQIRAEPGILKKEIEVNNKMISTVRDPCAQRLRVFESVRQSILRRILEWEPIRSDSMPITALYIAEVFQSLNEIQSENPDVSDEDLRDLLQNHVKKLPMPIANRMLMTLIGWDQDYIKQQELYVSSLEKRNIEIQIRLRAIPKEEVALKANALILIRQRSNYLSEQLKYDPNNVDLNEEFQQAQREYRNISDDLKAIAMDLNRRRSPSPKDIIAFGKQNE